ncbi:MAG TPA: DUF4124 domain-containing protein [Burkholderiales bacterium]|jgi:hypothetical protein|nr:DUF4124 domain-containing protein [Burkholderiales bacterium]
MIRIALFMIAALATAAVQAQVNKCVDSNGKIFYSQNPCPPNMKRETMSRGGIPPASAVAPAEGAADKAAKSDATKAPRTPAQQKEDQAKAAKVAEQKTAEAQAKEANCRNARQRLANFEIGGRISQINEKGERYYMEDAQIEAGKTQARADVSQYCN